MPSSGAAANSGPINWRKRQTAPDDFPLKIVRVFSNALPRHEFVFMSPIGLNLLPNAFVKAKQSIVGHTLDVGAIHFGGRNSFLIHLSAACIGSPLSRFTNVERPRRRAPPRQGAFALWTPVGGRKAWHDRLLYRSALLSSRNIAVREGPTGYDGSHGWHFILRATGATIKK